VNAIYLDIRKLALKYEMRFCKKKKGRVLCCQGERGGQEIRMQGQTIEYAVSGTSAGQYDSGSDLVGSTGFDMGH
jgi:hypothetical protein